MSARIIPFPSVPSGVRATGLLLDTLKSSARGVPARGDAGKAVGGEGDALPAAGRGRPPYSERELATADGEINEHVIIALAWHHAQRDQDAFKARGEYEPLSGLFRSQLQSFTGLARSMAATRKAHQEAEGMSLTGKLIRSLELELYKAEHGLAMPYDAEKVAQIKQQIADALAAEAAAKAEQVRQ